MTNSLISKIQLSIQRALLGEITDKVRGVTFKLENNKIEILTYYDGEITEDNQESVDCALTEIYADFENIEISWDIKRIDYPHKIICLDHWVYLRKE